MRVEEEGSCQQGEEKEDGEESKSTSTCSYTIRLMIERRKEQWKGEKKEEERCFSSTKQATVEWHGNELGFKG